MSRRNYRTARLARYATGEHLYLSRNENHGQGRNLDNGCNWARGEGQSRQSILFPEKSRHHLLDRDTAWGQGFLLWTGCLKGCFPNSMPNIDRTVRRTRLALKKSQVCISFSRAISNCYSMARSRLHSTPCSVCCFRPLQDRQTPWTG